MSLISKVTGIPPRGNLDDALIKEAAAKQRADAKPVFEFSITPNLDASESTGSLVDDIRQSITRLGVGAKITIHF